MEQPLVDHTYLLEKYPGKGGWTYAAIPEILQDKSKPFGWVKVKGTIDGFEINNFGLAPMGNGKLFMPINATIRKKIKKQAGDSVRLILYADHTIFEIPQELIDCLLVDTLAHQKFMSLKLRYQKEFVNWIYAAKREETKVNRINATIESVLMNKTLYKKMDD
ncbi:MAG: YdeI/OmpD-associated family protein [bacterium]|nr:YdeI/OmpD-associated family protein [bacterium]